MKSQFDRNIMLIGKQKQNLLASKKILVVGCGGVGGMVIELLARAGVGAIDLCDGDTIDITNINRQLIATHSNIGQYKVDAWKERVLAINPKCKVKTFNENINIENMNDIIAGGYDFVIDAFDQYVQKAQLMVVCSKNKIKSIHSCGAANRFDPSKFEVGNLEQVKGDWLANLIKEEIVKMKKKPRDIKVVYSTEQPIKSNPPASMAFTPNGAGMKIAHYVFGQLTK